MHVFVPVAFWSLCVSLVTCSHSNELIHPVVVLSVCPNMELFLLGQSAWGVIWCLFFPLLRFGSIESVVALSSAGAFILY